MFCFIAFTVKSWHIYFLAHAFTGAPYAAFLTTGVTFVPSSLPLLSRFLLVLAIFPVFYVLLPAFVIGSFYNTICINILLLFCLLTSSSISVGPRIDALKPLEELIPGVLAASKAPSTVKGCHSQFQKWKVQRCFCSR